MSAVPPPETPLLTVTGLRIEVYVPDDGWSEAVSGLSLTVHRGEALGLVGESGCGKSLTVLSLLGLLPASGVRRTHGAIQLEGWDLALGGEAAFRSVRGSRIGYVPQDPMTALNPVFPVGEQVAEAVRLHHAVGRAEGRARTLDLLAQVGLPAPEARYGAYPHELSGGQRQRVLIAMALAGDPELLLADEPTTALDVTVQAEVLRLIGRLRRDRALGVLLVTHDLGVVAETCDRVAVLYAGQCVETGPAADVLARPAHPYTRGLLDSLPGATTGRLRAIPGNVPPVGQWPSGCRFRDRCPRAEGPCAREAPLPRPIGPRRTSACHFAESVQNG